MVKILIESIVVLIGCFILGIICSKWIVKRFFLQSKQLITHIAQNTELEAAISTMMKTNVFVYLNGIVDSDASQAFLGKLSEAWTIVSAQPEFEVQKFRVAFGMNNCTVSKELLDTLQNNGWLYANSGKSKIGSK